jgi:hypothetical protein
MLRAWQRSKQSSRPSSTRLKETVRRLIAHTEVVAVAVRTPEAVPQAELDEAIAGIHGLYEQLLP